MCRASHTTVLMTCLQFKMILHLHGWQYSARQLARKPAVGACLQFTGLLGLRMPQGHHEQVMHNLKSATLPACASFVPFVASTIHQ